MCLQVPPAYLIQGRPLELEGEVVAGFGRGSSRMGVPTANIAPVPLAAKLEGLPLGVYFGCAAARSINMGFLNISFAAVATCMHTVFHQCRGQDLAVLLVKW